MDDSGLLKWVFRGRIRPKAYPVPLGCRPRHRLLGRTSVCLQGFSVSRAGEFTVYKKRRLTRSSPESQSKCELEQRLAGKAGGAQFTVTLAHSAMGQFGSRASVESAVPPRCTSVR